MYHVRNISHHQHPPVSIHVIVLSCKVPAPSDSWMPYQEFKPNKSSAELTFAGISNMFLSSNASLSGKRPTQDVPPGPRSRPLQKVCLLPAHAPFASLPQWLCRPYPASGPFLLPHPSSILCPERAFFPFIVLIRVLL